MSDSEDRLELFFSQPLDGFFFMMLDEPVRWDRAVDKDRILDYTFEHQRITKVNDAMLEQYGATHEQFLGLTPRDFYRHDLEYGRRVWRQFFDRDRLHVETDERRLDGTPIWIQRDVTERKRAEGALRRYSRRLQVLHDTQRAILASRSARGIAEATMRHIGELLSCWQASVAVFDATTEKATILALHAEGPTPLVAGTVVPAAVFGVLEDLRQGVVSVVEDVTSSPLPSLLQSLVAEGLRSYISVPMRADPELIGVLGVDSRSGSSSTPPNWKSGSPPGRPSSVGAKADSGRSPTPYRIWCSSSTRMDGTSRSCLPRRTSSTAPRKSCEAGAFTRSFRSPSPTSSSASCIRLSTPARPSCSNIPLRCRPATAGSKAAPPSSRWRSAASDASSSSRGTAR